MNINGYICQRKATGFVYIEGSGIITDEQAREKIGIEKKKRELEYLEKLWSRL